MVNRNLLRQFDPTADELQLQLDDPNFLDSGTDWLPPEGQSYGDGKVVTGRVRKVDGEEVWIDVGYKSEGSVELREWFDEASNQVIAPKPGDSVEVLLESSEDDGGSIVLSYRKALRQRLWEEVISKHKEGDVVSGPVTRKIKGGLLVNIGINAFLPASQVDVRRTADLGELIGKNVECKIVVIDRGRRNIIVSRRKLIEDRRTELKTKLLAEIEPGQVRTGIVRNIPRSEPSSTWAAWTACSTSPTWPGAASPTRPTWSTSTSRSRSWSSRSTARRRRSRSA